MKKEILFDRIVKQSEELLPGEFYDIRQETAPKAAWAPMYCLATLAYIGAITAFVCLFVTESKKSITDTIITTSDYTGHDGYTCQMISKVTASYQISSASGIDPSQEYNLVNIIESKAQFEQDIAMADPCSAPLTYFPATDVTTSGSRDVTFGAMTMLGETMAYAFNAATGEIISYNYSAGTESTVTADYDPVVTSLAIDRSGNAIFLSESNGDRKNVFRKDLVENHEAEKIYSFDLPSTPIILNDNLYNIYLAENSTFCALDVYSNFTATSTTLFSVPAGNSIVRAAVYNNGSAIKVYYLNQNDELYSWQNGAFTFFDVFENVLGMAVDGSDNVYFLSAQTGYGYDVSTIDQSFVAYVDSVSPSGGFAISPSGARTFLSTTVTEGIESLAFIYDIADGIFITDDTFRTDEVVNLVSGFGAGWFTCGAEVLNATDYTPSVREEYPYQCLRNGVVGQVLYNDYYLFTPTDAAAYALSKSTGHCSSMYSTIAETIADLPPYSCTRTTHPGFFVCLATAVANTQLLFQILVFFFAMLLTKLAPRYPPQRTHAAPAPHVNPEVEMASLEQKVVKSPMV